jgi:hypothetical protein
MRLSLALFSVLALSLPAGTRAADEPSTMREGTVVIADSNSLSFRQSRKSDVRQLSDLDREETETIMRINATRGTWQSYLLYTTPEMKVPASRPGFIITLPPPNRKELERRRRERAEAEQAVAAMAPQPAAQSSSAR